MDIASTVWGTSVRKRITVTFGSITAVAGAIVAVPPAWSQLGLPEMASKMYVERTLQPLRLAQQSFQRTARDIQIDIAEGKRSQAQEAIAKWTLELQRSRDAQSTQLIQTQIRELQNTSDRLGQQIRTLGEIK